MSELNPSAHEVEMIAAAQEEFEQVCFNISDKEINRIEAIHLDSTYLGSTENLRRVQCGLFANRRRIGILRYAGNKADRILL
jgi:hypothetical protein